MGGSKTGLKCAYVIFEWSRSIQKSDDEKSFTITSGKNKIEVVNSPFRMDFYSDGILVVSANARQLMRFEATKGLLTF